jgi:beta-mannosidase
LLDCSIAGRIVRTTGTVCASHLCRSSNQAIQQSTNSKWAVLRSTYFHSGWEFAEDGWVGEKPAVGNARPSWLPAQVPGHVHLDLVDNGVIADPFARMNELGCQWVDQKAWLYRTTFEFEPDPSLPRRVLRFEGLDTIATVSLNGEAIGQSDNMFVPLELDVTEKLVTGRNELQIRFESAILKGLERRSTYLAKEGLPDKVCGLDDRAFVRKAQYMYGWDWGPRLVSCGIWKPVRLVEYSSRILDVRVDQLWKDDGSVEVRVGCETEGQGQINVSLSREGSTVEETAPGVFSIADPALWWPNGMGQPDMYHLLVELTDGGELEHDFVTMPIGLRTVKLVRERDSLGESFGFEINGKPLWARGANWIPDHSFPSVVSEERYRDRIQDAWQLGCNMIRVWGGGLYESEPFYEYCDLHGILVWQDFAFACSYYPDDTDAQESLAKEALINVKRLRNHPSLAIWCGNNENQSMWHEKWGGAQNSPPRHVGLKLYLETLPSVLAKEDPSRPYVSSSPIWGSTEDDSASPGGGGTGDQHYWDVWHGRGDWRHYADSTSRFCSEYGFASSCSREVWDSVLTEAEEQPGSTVVQWHDKTGKGWPKFLEYVKLHYPEAATLDDWIYYSQLNHRDAIRFGLEHFRRSEFCRGSLIWQLNDCWPVQSWALVDYKGNYKAAGYELQRLHEDLLFSIVRDKEKITLWAANDGLELVMFEAELTVRTLAAGASLRTVQEAFELQPGDRRPLLEESLEGLSVPDILIVGGDAAHQTWQLAVEPKAARCAEPEPILVSTHSDGALRIRTDTPLVDLFLSSNGSTRPFLENFVTVPEPGTFEVQVWQECPNLVARSLAGFHPVRVTRSPL